jgi:hypothetical protein
LALVKVVSILAVHTSLPASPVEDGMRIIVSTFAGLVALAAVSVQAAPLPPVEANPGRTWRSPSNGAGRPRLRPRLAPPPLARLLGPLALGQMCPELVIR